MEQRQKLSGPIFEYLQLIPMLMAGSTVTSFKSLIQPVRIFTAPLHRLR